ncbi:peptidylprolyl isomerase [Maribellus maritimus]|uniref:peptidylprolyl isomerase n=1 Tax=Maribellus maritimus TaxID=2870838 RepID=UPI001EEAF494|nr:peptidylprolyl isomerase [Maribellus maritimus]MCG6189213.1 peptidyl-prolyl cis-trans isomerase [Maribellus maritimus]
MFQLFYTSLCIVLIGFSCKLNVQNDVINDEIVLQIDSFKITKYEFEKNKKRAIESKTFGNTNVWSEQYINNAYLLTDAYNEKYDTISAINKKVNYAARTMLGQYKGYLWNKIEEPKLIFTKKEIKNIHKKQNKTFELEYFIFPDSDSFYSIFENDIAIKTKADFLKVVEMCKTSTIKHKHIQLLYPFNELEPVKDFIYSLDNEDAAKISLDDNKILVVYLKKKSERKQKDFKREEEAIKLRYTHLKERQIVNNKRDFIYGKADININKKVKDKIFRKIKESSRAEENTSFSTDTILTYNQNNETKALLASDFFDYYYNNPLTPIITNNATLEETLKQIVLEQYLYFECVNLGITNSKEFLLDKKNYKNSLVLEKYIEDNFLSEEIHHKELSEYYNNNKNSFTTCRKCSVCILTFKNTNSAISHVFQLDKIATQGGIKNQSDTILMNLDSYQKEVAIDISDKKYSPEIIEKLFTADLNKRIGPIEFNNKAIVLVKTNEFGKEILPFEIARKKIKKQLVTAKMEKLKTNRLRILKNKYPIAINTIKQ